MKAIRSLETGKRATAADIEPRRLTQRLVTAHPERLRYVVYAFERGMTVREVAAPDHHGPLVPLPGQADRRRAAGRRQTPLDAHRRRPPHRQAHGHLRRPPRHAWRGEGNRGPDKFARLAKQHGIRRSSSWSTPAPPSSNPSRPTSTAATTKKTKPSRRPRRRSSSSAAAPTASARASSSTTAAATRRLPSG